MLLAPPRVPPATLLIVSYPGMAGCSPELLIQSNGLNAVTSGFRLLNQTILAFVLSQVLVTSAVVSLASSPSSI